MAEDVVGLQDLLNSLDKLPAAVSKQILAQAARKGAQVMKDRAQELVPVATGTLRDSIIVSVQEQAAFEAFARVGPSTEGWYGHFVEFGTGANFDAAAAKEMGLPGKSRNTTGSARPRPYLRPAFDEKSDEALELIAEHLRDSIEKQARA